MKIKKLMLSEPLDISAGLALEEELYTVLTKREMDLGYLIWRSKKALVVPRSATRNEKFELAAQQSAEKGWPVVVRSTGGELTPQCEQFFNLSIFMRCGDKQISIKESYLIICNALIRWLDGMGIKGECASIEGAFCDGDYNVNIGGKKLVGTAQRWRKALSIPNESEEKALLLHAVILCDGDINALFDISNSFYETCGVEPFIKFDRHISLAMATGSDNPDFVADRMKNFNQFMEKYISEIADSFYP